MNYNVEYQNQTEITNYTTNGSEREEPIDFGSVFKATNDGKNTEQTEIFKITGKLISFAYTIYPFYVHIAFNIIKRLSGTNPTCVLAILILASVV